MATCAIPALIASAHIGPRSCWTYDYLRHAYEGYVSLGSEDAKCGTA